MKTGRMIEIIKSRLNDELCFGCEIYGEIACGCSECARMALKQILNELEERKEDGRDKQTESD